MKLVIAEGNRSSGSMRSFGLDCSGFVTWNFINSGFNASAIGHGTQSQVKKGTHISPSFAQPGDLAFFNDVSHVGIVAGKDASGNIFVIHCSSSANGDSESEDGFAPYGSSAVATTHKQNTSNGNFKSTTYIANKNTKKFHYP